MYAVFEQHLLTDKGKSLVCLYEATSDAQAIHADLVMYYTQSVKASLDQSQLMIYITMACMVLTGMDLLHLLSFTGRTRSMNMRKLLIPQSIS